DAVGGLFAVFDFGGARQQHDFVGHLAGGCPHFLAVDDVAAVNLLGKGGDLGGVETGIGLGKTETALVFAGHQAGNPARLLLGAALDHDGVGAEEVNVYRRGCRHTAAAVAGDFVHHNSRFGDAQAR